MKTVVCTEKCCAVASLKPVCSASFALPVSITYNQVWHMLNFARGVKKKLSCSVLIQLPYGDL